jgi:hypothetical protein
MAQSDKRQYSPLAERLRSTLYRIGNKGQINGCIGMAINDSTEISKAISGLTRVGNHSIHEKDTNMPNWMSNSYTTVPSIKPTVD